MMRPQHVLERFHVNQNSAGARDWLALTYRYAAGEQISVIVQDLARKANRPSAAIYARVAALFLLRKDGFFDNGISFESRG